MHFSIYCLAGRFPGEGPCNYSRLELYLLSLGKVKMLTQYPQISSGRLFGGAGDVAPQASPIITIINYQCMN